MIAALNHDKETKFDPIDFVLFSKYKWAYDTSTGYVYYKRGNVRKLFLHRLIMNPPKGMVVDHINNDKLDNRRKNLRVCTISENIRKHAKMRRKTSSEFMGVSTFRDGWRAYIYFDGRQKSLGCYKTEKEAATAYNKFAKEKFDKGVTLNQI